MSRLFHSYNHNEAAVGNYIIVYYKYHKSIDNIIIQVFLLGILREINIIKLIRIIIICNDMPVKIIVI